MALRFADSFQHYQTADIGNKWTTTAGGASIVAGQGRWGGQAMLFGDNDTANKVFSGLGTWIIGFAMRISSYPQAGTQEWLVFLEGATIHVNFFISLLGQLSVARNGSTLATGSTLAIGKWYYLEAQVTISDTVGAVNLKINGVNDINISGVDTRNAGTGIADTLRIRGGAGSNWAWYCNDLYICDTSGSAPTNTFLGDVRVDYLTPDGNGATSNLVGSDGNSVDNYLLVDEATAPNGDTDYVESQTVADKDTYTYTSPSPTAGTVYGVQTVPYVRKTDAGSRSFRNLARLSGTEIDNGTDIAMSTTYDYYESIFETKPGGGAWSITDVQNAEFGYKIVA